MPNQPKVRYQTSYSTLHVQNELYHISVEDVFKLSLVFRVSETRFHELMAIVNQSVLEKRIDYCQYMFKRDEETITRGRTLGFALYCIDNYDMLITGLAGMAVASFNAIAYETDAASNSRFLLIGSNITVCMWGIAKVAGSYIRPRIEEKKANEMELMARLINLAKTGEFNGGAEAEPVRRIGILAPDRSKISIPVLPGLSPCEIEQQLAGARIIPASERNTAWIHNEFNHLKNPAVSQNYGTITSL